MRKEPPALVRLVGMGYPAAVQTIAALEDRIAQLRGWGLGEEAWAIADAHAALAAVRTAFDVWPKSDAQRDATHEAEGDDVPLALHIYQAEGR